MVLLADFAMLLMPLKLMIDFLNYVVQFIILLKGILKSKYNTNCE